MKVASANTQAARGYALLPVAELALTGLTLATVISLWRLFADGSYLLPLTAHAVAAHALTAALRRRGVGTGLSAAMCLAAATIALVWAHLPASTWYGVPTTETLRVAYDQLELGWRTFGDVRAPAPVLTGFLLSTGAVLWLIAWLSDLAAFRHWTPVEALIPSGTLFLFTSIFSADRARPLAAVLWLSGALAFVLLHRTARQQTSPSWLGSDARIGTLSLVKAGAALALPALVLGWVIGPQLPGAEADPLAPFSPHDRDGGRTTISPLVEMRGRLVEQSQAELFTVTSSERAYWRLTSLDIFDGEVWSSRGSFGDADGRLAGSGNRSVPSQPITQTYDILDLSTIWLPTAFEATELHIDDAEVRWDDLSSTLIVSTDLDTSDGLRYEVVSDIPAFEPALLHAGGEVPGDIRDRNVDLPRGFPPAVTTEAERIVAGASTPYERALALQNSFRDGSFEYSLAAPAGHSDSAIEDFLFITRTGYCEQFAAAFAAMARAVGLPARVAVGFTPGDADPLEPNRYVVRGENAHAWPEVYIAGAGWVAFEPTPGRGAPGAQAYTGVLEQQDAAGPSTEATIIQEDVDPAAPQGEAPEEGAGTTAPPLEDVGAEPDAIDLGNDNAGASAAQVAAWTGLALAVATVIGVVGGAGVALVRVAARRRRRATARSPEALVRVLGDEATEHVAVLGILRPRHETDTEFTRRLGRELGSRQPSRLGQLMTRASFDPEGISVDEAAEGLPIVEAIREAVHQRTTTLQRLLAAADPRSPQRRAQARARARARVQGAARPTGPRIQISTAAER